MASSLVWQHHWSPLPSCSPLAVSPARPWDEGASRESCWAHRNSKGSAQQSGPKSGKGLQNDPSLMVITKSKQVTSASLSQFAPSQEQVCNKTSPRKHTGLPCCEVSVRLLFQECESLPWATAREGYDWTVPEEQEMGIHLLHNLFLIGTVDPRVFLSGRSWINPWHGLGGQPSHCCGQPVLHTWGAFSCPCPWTRVTPAARHVAPATPRGTLWEWPEWGDGVVCWGGHQGLLLWEVTEYKHTLILVGTNPQTHSSLCVCTCVMRVMALPRTAGPLSVKLQPAALFPT